MKLKIFKSSKKRKGFSLIEILVAVFVFSIAIAMLTGSFASFYKNYSNAKKIQKDVENAQYAMNLMAKTLRTSYVDESSNAYPMDLITYDYSQGLCVRYKYDTGSKKIQNGSIEPSDTSNPTTSCAVDTSIPLTDLSSGNITYARANITPTDSSLGKVTIVLNVQSGTPTAIPIQMSVSLRQ